MCLFFMKKIEDKNFILFILSIKFSVNLIIFADLNKNYNS